ncbi:hypothetical protein NST63_24505 [Heyndrickxia sp. FSL W8-0496]|uniref:hypothetical protein n=1 Tax=Heyndrickxia sp. FSL W8-0496 TaxID=2954702 RepID=UPI0030FB80BE
MFEEFIDENLIKTESFIKIHSKEVYERFLLFCKHNGFVMNISNRSFYSQLEMLGIVKGEHGDRKYYWGWYLKKCKY